MFKIAEILHFSDRNNCSAKFLDLWKKEILRLRGHQCSDSNKVSYNTASRSLEVALFKFNLYKRSVFVAVDLHMFFQKVSDQGGYDGCVSKKAWKLVYDELGGNPQNTSAATCTRRHYEK